MITLCLSAQNIHSGYHSNAFILNSNSNPATFPEAKVVVGFPALSHFSVGLQSPLSLNELYEKGEDDSLRLNIPSIPSFLDDKDALMLTKDSHFVIGIYNPKNLINRYAASNKVAEALAIGRPIIINKEMEITKIFSESSAAVIAEFGDTDSWAKQIVKFQHDYEEYLKASLSARDVYNEHYKWSEARKTLIKVLS